MTRLIRQISVAWIVLVILSLTWNYQDVRSQRQEDALLAARGLFQQVLLARAWNASHGGVYVPVTENTRPNPYLLDKDRDIRVNEQLTLTRINPAFMTRQMAELAAANGQDIAIHITSLKPLRPENRAT